MQLDSRDEGWKPAHDHEVRLRNPWVLAIALAVMALGAAASMTAPASAQKPRSTVAGELP